ncbi:hypothetical protein WSM22_25860 [Cytophagales bacterium WSM2-2]|nr:hypothetical protein WSM22_25860 [Cytophagales bacterium WSM2-2]
MHVKQSGFLLVLATVLFLFPNISRADSKTECDKIEKLNRTAEGFLFILPDSAFHYANEARQKAVNENCLPGIANSYHIIGKVFFHQGVYQEAINNLLKADDLFKRLNNKRLNAENLNQLGLVYYNIKQPNLALEVHQRALQLYQELKDEKGIAFSFGCIGHLYEKKKSYEQALSYQNQALEFYQKNDDPQGTATILENIGSIYEDLENYELALKFFMRALKLNEIARDSLAMIVNINNIGDNYRKTQQYDKAIDWTKRAVDLSTRLKDKYQLCSAYKDLGKIYSLTGDFKNAYKNLDIGRNMYQDLYTQDATRQLALFQTLFEIERKNHDLQQFELDRKLNNTIKATLASSLALFAMLGGVVISRQRLKIRRNKEIIEQNEIRNKLMLTEIENTHLHEQRLQQELDTKSKALTSHTLNIITKNKTLEDIQQKLNDFLKDGPGDHRKGIKSLVKDDRAEFCPG